LADAAINITLARGIALIATTAYNRYLCEKNAMRAQPRSKPGSQR